MWFVPPDVGTKVLVIFAEGNPNMCYWIGCVNDTYQNFAVPGNAATTFLTDGTPEDLKGKFAGLPNLTKQVTAHGVTRYMTGSFKNISEAAAFKEELLKTGFPDAFLVAYYENDRVKLSDMVEILKSAQ